jgi:ATPase subunit of ABC transporter with duplicated ATPase domains
MTLFNFSPCSFSLANGDVLYRDVQLALDNGLSALIGRNGSGKSVLAAQLAQQQPADCYLLSQLPPTHWQQLRLADLLGITDKLNALQQLADGQCDTETLSIIDGHWQLTDDLHSELQQIGAAPDIWQRCSSLSGGQLNHLRLWWAFYQQRPLLILDEPSNHLDVQARNGLSQRISRFLARPKNAILLVSHDRELLQQVSVIYKLNSSGLSRYGGNYEFYQQQRQLQQTALQQQRQQAERNLAQQQRQAQTAAERAAKRQQQGEKRRGSQATILLDYQKNRAQSAVSARRAQEQHQLKQAQQQLQQVKAQQEVIKPQQFYLQAPAITGSKQLVNAVALQLVYGNNQPLSFNWRSKQRVHLQGCNGSGKSTLLQTLAGLIAPAAGQLQLNCAVQYLDQHFSLLNSSQSALANLRRHCPLLSETTARTLLASAGLRADKALKPAGVLSGGERMKLAMLMVSQHSDSLLLLDEPDNHLDLGTKQLLAQALYQYPAGFVVVSHDAHFIAQLEIDTVLQI